MAKTFSPHKTLCVLLTLMATKAANSKSLNQPCILNIIKDVEDGARFS